MAYQFLSENSKPKIGRKWSNYLAISVTNTEQSCSFVGGYFYCLFSLIADVKQQSWVDSRQTLNAKEFLYMPEEVVEPVVVEEVADEVAPEAAPEETEA